MSVNCEFNILGWRVYCCEIKKQEILKSALIFRGEHESGKANEDVNRLIIEDCEMPQLPQSISDTFKNIEELTITNSNLKSLTKFDLKQFENLEKIQVSGNDIEFLPGDLFEFTKKIRRIDLCGNNIKFIGPKIFGILEKFIIIDLKDNVNIDCSYGYSGGVSLGQFKERIRTDCKPPMDEREMLKKYGRDPDETSIQQHLVEKRSCNVHDDDEEFSELDCAHGSQHDANTSNHLRKRTRADSKPSKGNPKVQQKRPSSFQNELKEFLKLDDFKDFTIKVADREFKVHKFLFVVRSETFAELIKNNPEAEDLELQDIPVEVFECILSFVYDDELPETQNIHEVFAAASKLKMKGLIELTAGILATSIENEKNLMVLHKIMSLAKKFEHEELKLKAFGEIKKHFPGRNLKDELADQPDKLKALINAKLAFEQQLHDLDI